MLRLFFILDHFFIFSLIKQIINFNFAKITTSWFLLLFRPIHPCVGCYTVKTTGWSASSLADLIRSKFCTLVQSMCVDIEHGLQQGNVSCSVYCESCALVFFFFVFVYNVYPQNKKLVFYLSYLRFFRRSCFSKKTT